MVNHLFHGSIWEINLGNQSGWVHWITPKPEVWSFALLGTCATLLKAANTKRYGMVAAPNLHELIAAFLARQHVDNML